MGIAYNPKTVTDGLVLCIDAANPKSYPGSGTTWFDLSGNENNFNLINSPSYSSNGWLSFNGVNQYANIGSRPTLNLSPSNNRTLEIWGRVNAIGSLGGLFADQYSTSGVLMVMDTGRFLWRWDDSATTLIYQSQKQLQPGEWFQCVIVLRNSYFATYYVNGVLDTNEFRTTDTGSSSNSSWSIGRQNRSFSGDFYHLNCDISVAKQYNRMLTPEEIQQNFNATRGRYGI
jgi:hypothetical protein